MKKMPILLYKKSPKSQLPMFSDSRRRPGFKFWSSPTLETCNFEALASKLPAIKVLSGLKLSNWYRKILLCLDSEAQGQSSMFNIC